MQLRPYQQRAIDALYDWFRQNSKGNPCLVLPTGSGKSHIVASLCKDAVQSWPETQILMLTHQKELIEQNAEKMRQHWPGAPLGIYSASIGQRDLGEPITFAGIQSVRTRADEIGHIDLVIVDEAHAINHRAEGGYRTLIDGLRQINPALRVVGLTATPYRLGHGLITDEPAIFHGLVEPVSVEELVFGGYLARLRSKQTETTLSTEGVKKRGGEYIERDLQRAVNTEQQNCDVVAETIARAEGRKSWLFFCTGVEHANNIADELRARGVTAACVTGETPKKERAQILADFKAGKITALTNANVLTTGFDAPNIDLIAMVRPTMSAGLYVQMAGRGMRVCEGKEDCLVLDFAGVVRKHGPITAVEPPKRNKEGGEAPVKTCEKCHELCHTAAKECPSCGHPFPIPEGRGYRLHNDDIMGMDEREMDVSGWEWREHISRTSGKLMMCVTYYGALSDTPVREYLPVLHEGYAGRKALRTLTAIASAAQVNTVTEGQDGPTALNSICHRLNRATPPEQIEYKMDGKFHRVLHRRWPEQSHDASEGGQHARTA